jgi:patatin-like phospholipase/acyl hydrolase
MAKFKILSVDGGGIRGMVAATIISRLDLEHSGFIASADLFAGTSTGSIIACGLASGISTKQLIDLYAACGQTVFDKNPRNVFGLTGAKYKNAGLKRLLADLFGMKRLGDLQKKVLVPTFCLKSNEEPRQWKPKFYHNFGSDGDNDKLVAEVVLQSCSAPTYFPAYAGHIDGGMVANNPSMAALCQALDSRYPGNAQLSDVALLSVGTGETYKFIRDPDYSFGLLDISKIVDIILGGTESVPDYQCKVLLGDRYMRVDPFDPKGVEMDDYGQVAYLRRLAIDFGLKTCEEWIGRNWI